MEATLQVLGELVQNSVPTMVLFAITWVAYVFLVHKPLSRILEERHARTEGAVAKAQADIAAAEAKTAEYEQRLREARSVVFKGLEARRKQLTDSRAAAIAEARRKAEAQVAAAREEIEREAVAAKAALHAQADSLANEVIEAVLRPSRTAPVAGR